MYVKLQRVLYVKPANGLKHLTFEHGSLKCTNAHVYINFSWEAAIQTHVSEPGVNIALMLRQLCIVSDNFKVYFE